MLEQQINDAFLAAYKSKEEKLVGTLRLLKSALLNKKIDKRIAKDEILPDDEVIALLKSEIKKRQDSIEAYRVGNRPELAAVEEAELAILIKYLPEQMSEEQVKTIVAEVLVEKGNPGPSGFGIMMKEVMARTKGSADGGLVSKILKEELAK